MKLQYLYFVYHFLGFFFAKFYFHDLTESIYNEALRIILINQDLGWEKLFPKSFQTITFDSRNNKTKNGKNYFS